MKGTSHSPLLVGLPEAAVMLSLSKRTVQQLVYDGLVASIKIGRARRFLVADLESFVQRLRDDATLPPQMTTTIAPRDGRHRGQRVRASRRS